MNILTLIFDLDGTLLNRAGQLSPLTIQVLQQLQQQGLTLIYATGRSPFMASLVQHLPPGYFLCNNGAQIYQQQAINQGQFRPSAEQLIDQKGLHPEIARHVIAAARQYRLHLECNYSTHTVYEHLDHACIARYGNPILEINAQQVDWDQTDLQHCVKFATMGEEEELKPFILALNRSLPGRLHLAYSYPGYLEITDPLLNKREQMRTLFAQLQHDYSTAMAFGDGANDIQILQAAAVGVMMSNAHPTLAQQGQHLYLAPHHDREGVAQFLRSWFHLS